MRKYTDEDGNKYWFECVQTALYDDRLTDKVKKELVSIASSYSCNIFQTNYDTKLKWFKFIGGKQNYELRREIEAVFLIIKRQLDLAYELPEKTRMQFRKDVYKHAKLERQSYPDYYISTAIKKRLTNESIIKLTKKWYKKLPKERQYKINSYRKDEKWKDYMITEDCGGAHDFD